MSNARLNPFLRSNLDILFVALNPPTQSNANGHYFSGKGSRFYDLLFQSGLILRPVPKSIGDELVFGSAAENFSGKQFGVVDLVPETVQTDSAKVRPARRHVAELLERVRSVEPRFVCILHSKVRDALSKHARLTQKLTYGTCGAVLPGTPAVVVMNYFPNGNAIKDEPKLRIFRELRDAL